MFYWTVSLTDFETGETVLSTQKRFVNETNNINSGTNSYGSIYIGDLPLNGDSMSGGALYNQLNVSGATTLLTYSNTLYVGRSSAYAPSGIAYFNSLVISNGGQVSTSLGTGVIGEGTTADNNSAVVTGTNSKWTVDRLDVGFYGDYNCLLISNSGSMQVGTAYIGISGSGNQAIVTGSGSLLAISRELNFGGSANSLIISNGGSVNNGNAFVGGRDGSGYNSVLVTGTNSIWNNVGSLAIGLYGAGNRLVISNGGRVTAWTSWIGSQNTALDRNSSNNSVLVTGTNSLFTNSGDLYLGNFGSKNSLVISNGGCVVNGSGAYIGAETTASGNSVT
jgi:T5SS/PEP-CTERM-associated repeat protein